MEKDRNNLDLFRILLAVMVILGHTAVIAGTIGPWLDPIKALTGFTYSGALAVKLFFFISGLVVANSLLRNPDPLRFAVARAFRILPGLALLLVLTAFLVGPLASGLSASRYFSSPEPWAYVGRNMIFDTAFGLPGLFLSNPDAGVVNGSLWSLQTEVGCYLALVALFMVLKKRKALNLAFGLIALEAFLPRTWRFMPLLLGPNPEINFLPFCFSLGCLAALNQDDLQVDASLASGSAILVLILRSTYLAEPAFVAACAACLLWASSNKAMLRLKPRWDISYGVYLWGFLAQQLLRQYLPGLPSIAHFALASLIALCLGLGSYLGVEKPGMELGRKLNSAIAKRAKPA
jgi:peptidoglycan/LPS O-acetylase OafA/YrhL